MSVSLISIKFFKRFGMSTKPFSPQTLRRQFSFLLITVNETLVWNRSDGKFKVQIIKLKTVSVGSSGVIHIVLTSVYFLFGINFFREGY